MLVKFLLIIFMFSEKNGKKVDLLKQEKAKKYCETQPSLKKKIVIHVMCEKSWIENSLRVVDLQMYPLKMTA